MIAEPESQPITIYEHLFQIYPDIPQYSQDHKRIEKYQTINKRFSLIYGKQPQYFVKGPGSISIFGDSSDYSQLPYIECCTPNDVVIALAENNSIQVRVNHFEKSRYPEQKIVIQQAELKQGNEWRNWIVMAIRAILSLKIKVVAGIDILVYSDLLDKNDLGKTSSLLYSLTFGIAAVSHQATSLTKQLIHNQLLKYNQKFEYLSLRSTSLYAQNNKLIDPLSKQVFDFIKGYTFVLAHSCTPFSPKSLQIKQGKKSNLKRCQVKIGIELIKSQLGIQKQFSSLKQLKHNLGYNTQEFLDCVNEYIPNHPMTVEEIQKSTEKSMIQILKPISFSNNVLEHFKSFFPYKQIVYLLKQQLLIEEIKALFRSQKDQSTKIQKIKQIFNKNRELQLQYLDSSSEQVIKLIEIAGQVNQGKCFKVIGDTAKGNVLFFVQKHRAQFLIDHFIKQYYQSTQMQMMLADSPDQYVYEVIPTQGVAILDPKYEIWL